jgi:phospholipid/cholesterol/gamma-HCH transport system substrate-binding protein
VLGALSLVLNGGGVAQLKTINVELTKAMAGRESDIQGRSTSSTRSSAASISRRPTSCARSTGSTASARPRRAEGRPRDGHRQSRTRLEGLADQRKALTTDAHRALRPRQVGTRVINASKADTVANLKALQPTLTKLADAGANLPKALEMALTYPFPAAATAAVRGDYTNLRITADIDMRNIIGNLKPRGRRTWLPTRCPPCQSPVANRLRTALPTGGVGTGLPTISAPCCPSARPRPMT